MNYVNRDAFDNKKNGVVFDMLHVDLT